MKRCPECYSSYPETDRFCQLDGTTLVAEPGENDRVAGVQTEEELRALLTARAQSPRRRQYWEASALVAGVLIALGLVLFLVYQWMTPETQNSSDQPATNLSVAQPQVPVPPLYSVPKERGWRSAH
jgi:hypothetical protein